MRPNGLAVDSGFDLHHQALDGCVGGFTSFPDQRAGLVLASQRFERRSKLDLDLQPLADGPLLIRRQFAVEVLFEQFELVVCYGH
jgi:hypothetical protein